MEKIDEETVLEMLCETKCIHDFCPILFAVLGAGIFFGYSLLIVWVGVAGQEMHSSHKLAMLLATIGGLVCGWFVGIKFFQNKTKKMIAKISKHLKRNGNIRQLVEDHVSAADKTNLSYGEFLRRSLLEACEEKKICHE